MTTDAQLTYRVDIDVSGSAFGTAFAATDVTAKAVAGLGFEPITITWGRQDQFSSVNPTTVTGSLLNSDGLLSPGNASGTYYPRIRRGLRRRVSVTVATAGTVVLSEDYASSLEVVPAHDSPAVLNVEGADILARFGGTTSTTDQAALSIGTTMRTFLAEEMMLTAPSWLFMLQEADGATSFADVTGNRPPLVVTNSKYGAGVITAGQTPTGTFAAGTVVTITNANYGAATRGGSWLATTIPSTGVQGTTTVAWVQMPAAAPATASAVVFSLGSDSNARLLINTSGQLVFGGTASSTSVCDGKMHQVVIAGTTFPATVYLDGVALISFDASTLSIGPTLTIGMLDDGIGGTKAFSGGVAYVGLIPFPFTGANAVNNYNAGATAFTGLDTTGQRFNRLLSYRPNTGSSVATGLSTMGLQEIAGRSLQDCLLEVGQVEGGVVYVGGTGIGVFLDRSWAFNPTVVGTFDMTAGGVEFGSNWREDTQGVVNDVTVTNSTTGSDQRFVSASSVALDGEFSTSVQLPVNADTDALNLAGWMVANGTQAQLTATPLIINLLHLTPLQAFIALSFTPLQVIRLTNCPSPAPSSTMTFVVQGGTISLGADAATATLNLTPYPYPVGVWDSTKWDAAGVTWSF